MKFIQREIKSELIDMAGQYPVITLLGPRQSGKTTVIRTTFHDMPYVNLENPDTREVALSDPRALLGKYPRGAVFDEIQRAPELLSYIQVIVDQENRKGMYVLTGSHQFRLHQAISQSLAGRTALLNLLPLSMRELLDAHLDFELNDVLLQGGLPRIYADALDPTKAYRGYLKTYLERDLRELIQLKNLSTFQRFMKLCAGRIGQVLNKHSLSNDLGISSHTVEEWLSLLEASFLIFRLEPYFENFGKRVIKSPKLYFTDVGLAAFLLGIESKNQMDRDPLRGNLLENLVVLEIMKGRVNRGLDPNLYYYRDSAQHEVDLLYKVGRQLVPIEIKSSQTFRSEYLRSIEFFQNLTGERCASGFLIYAGDQEQKIKSTQLLHYKNAAAVIDALQEG